MSAISRTLPLALALLVSGCAGITPGERRITIDSTPPGATVLADGREVGTTPLTITPDDVFPPHWKGMSYLVEGTLTLRKPGCRDASMKVTDPVLSKDIHMALECDAVPPAPQPAARPAPAMPHMDSGEDAEMRLMRLERLHDKGLISDAEYRSIRQRILEGL